MNSENLTSLSQIDPDHIKIGVVIFIILLVMYFLQTILRKLLEHKLKNKILDKGISETLVSAVLQTDDNKHANIKWFTILMGVGIGLLIVNYSLPLGVHSFAIMAFSIALSFLTYHLYLQRANK